MTVYLREEKCAKCSHQFCSKSKIVHVDSYSICFSCHSCQMIMWAGGYKKTPANRLELFLALGEFNQPCLKYKRNSAKHASTEKLRP